MNAYVLFFHACQDDEIASPDALTDRWCVGELEADGFRRPELNATRFCFDCDAEHVQSFETFEEAVDVLRSKVHPL